MNCRSVAFTQFAPTFLIAYSSNSFKHYSSHPIGHFDTASGLGTKQILRSGVETVNILNAKRNAADSAADSAASNLMPELWRGTASFAMHAMRKNDNVRTMSQIEPNLPADLRSASPSPSCCSCKSPALHSADTIVGNLRGTFMRFKF